MLILPGRTSSWAAASGLTVTYGERVNSFDVSPFDQVDMTYPAGDFLVFVFAISNQDRSTTTFNISDVGDVGGTSSQALTKQGHSLSDTGSTTINVFTIASPNTAGGTCTIDCPNTISDAFVYAVTGTPTSFAFVEDGQDSNTDDALDDVGMSTAVLDGDVLIGAMQLSGGYDDLAFSSLTMDYEGASGAASCVGSKQVTADDASFTETFTANIFVAARCCRVLFRMRA